MQGQGLQNLRLIVPVSFGLIVALVAVTKSEWVGWVAAVGGILVAAFFVFTSMTRRGTDARH